MSVIPQFCKVFAVLVFEQDLNIPVKVIICETRREPDGLAMSSRNAYMSPAQRAAAPVVYLALKAAADGRDKATEAGR